MHNLILNYTFPHHLQADDVRNFWQLLEKQPVGQFEPSHLPDDRFGASEKVVARNPQTAMLKHQDAFFPIRTTYQPLDNNSSLLSLIFTQESQNQTLLSPERSPDFFAWVANTLHKGGRMLQAEVAFLSAEYTPNSSVKVELNKNTFAIEQYPIMLWLKSIQVDDDFLAKGGYATAPQVDGSHFLMSPELLQTMGANQAQATQVKVLKADIFANLPSADDRRNILRWIIHDYKEANQNILNLLEKALIDKDWEVRMSAVIACARFRATSLYHQAKAAEVPSTGRSGLNAEERGILGAIKALSLKLIQGTPIPPPLTAFPNSPQARRDYILRGIMEEATDFYHNSLLLIVALSDPIYPPKLPENLPKGVVNKEQQFFLEKSNIPLSFVPAYTHFIGSSDIPYHPVQLKKVENGFFISKFPIRITELETIMPTKSPKKGSHEHWLCKLEEAEAFCQRLSDLEGVKIILPNNMLWEMAARGHNGRFYPWGLTYDPKMLHRSSPWQLEQSVGFSGEWTSSQNKKGDNVIMGKSERFRCADMHFAPSTEHFALRIMIALEENPSTS